jgi:hypothetical protein
MLFTAIIMASTMFPALFLIACAMTVNMKILLCPQETPKSSAELVWNVAVLLLRVNTGIGKTAANEGLK